MTYHGLLVGVVLHHGQHFLVLVGYRFEVRAAGSMILLVFPAVKAPETPLNLCRKVLEQTHLPHFNTLIVSVARACPSPVAPEDTLNFRGGVAETHEKVRTRVVEKT